MDTAPLHTETTRLVPLPIRQSIDTVFLPGDTPHLQPETARRIPPPKRRSIHTVLLPIGTPPLHTETTRLIPAATRRSIHTVFLPADTPPLHNETTPLIPLPIRRPIRTVLLPADPPPLELETTRVVVRTRTRPLAQDNATTGFTDFDELRTRRSVVHPGRNFAQRRLRKLVLGRWNNFVIHGQCLTHRAQCQKYKTVPHHSFLFGIRSRRVSIFC